MKFTIKHCPHSKEEARLSQRPRDASCHWIFGYKWLKITQGNGNDCWV